MSSNQKPCHKQTIQPDKKALLTRLKRIEGQVRGIHQMIDDDRYCIDILTQVSAIRSALHSVSLQLIRNHTHGCVKRAVESGEGEAAIDELMTIMKKLS